MCEKDEPLGAALCACVDAVGEAPVPHLRPGSTRMALVRREERFEGRPGVADGRVTTKGLEPWTSRLAVA